MSTGFTQQPTHCSTSAPDFAKVVKLALVILAFLILPVGVRGQAEVDSSGGQVIAPPDHVLDRLVDQRMAERLKAQQDYALQADIEERYRKIEGLIHKELFDEADKEIRAFEEKVTKDSPLLKQLRGYLEKEIEAANRKAPLQAIKDELPDLLLSGNTTEARNKINEARKSFPQARELSDLSTLVTYVALLKKILISVGLLAILSAISVGIIYIWSRFVAACVYIFAVYLTSLPIAILLFLVIGPILALATPPEATGDVSSTREMQNFLALLKQVALATLSCCAGALGGAMAASFALVTSPLRVRPNLRFSTYFFKPVNGFFIAFIMYVGVMSGQLAFSSSGGELGDQARWSICLLAILSGFFSDAAIEKLREIKQALFGKEVVAVTDVDEVPDKVEVKKTRTETEKADGLAALDVEIVEKSTNGTGRDGEKIV
jgi:hypothetical protein